MENSRSKSEKKKCLFDSFVLKGLKPFIIQNERNIINKILFGINKFGKNDNIIKIISVKFSVLNFEKLNKNDLSNLSITAIDL